MPDLASEDMYSPQQINIPPTFPFILKQYAKAAIRTQPYDLLRWSAAYFRALAKGETPPIKERLEYPPPDTPSGLSPGYLKVLIKQLGKDGTVTLSQLLERWHGICLAEEPLHEMLAVGRFGETFDWLHFVAVAAGFLSNNLTQTMILLCNLLTDEPDGGSAMIPLMVFTKLYTFLAGLDCGGPYSNEDDDQREYVVLDGTVFSPICYQDEPTQLKRELVDPWQTESTLFTSHVTSSSAHQLYMASISPIASARASEAPPDSPSSSPPLTLYVLTDNASSSTLTPEKSQQDSEAEGGKALDAKKSMGTALETFYDANMKESPRSSQEAFDDDDENLEEHKVELIMKSEPTDEVTSEKASSAPQLKDVALAPLNAVAEPNISLDDKCTSGASFATQKSHSEVIKATTDVPSSGRGDVNQGTLPVVLMSHGSPKRKKFRVESNKKFPDVPGIGPQVDPIQVRAVIEYLESMAVKQEGMVRPSNIRHFLCPPLEKVPASQKTKV